MRFVQLDSSTRLSEKKTCGIDIWFYLVQAIIIRGSEPMRILIAASNTQFARSLRLVLSGAGYETESVYDENAVLNLAQSGGYELLLLCATINHANGLALVREIRQANIQIPIIMLGPKATIDDKIAGLDAGADDYMSTPFNNGELLARIRALTRRRPVRFLVVSRKRPARNSDQYAFGGLSFDPNNIALVFNGKFVRLNYKEAEIIKLLLTHTHTILSKQELINKVWGYGSDVRDNNVEAYISFLRKKLKNIGANVVIIAIKKQGYRLEQIT